MDCQINKRNKNRVKKIVSKKKMNIKMRYNQERKKEYLIKNQKKWGMII